MKVVLPSLAVVFAYLLTHFPVTRQSGQSNGLSTQDSSAPVVVELFTSEGCSSCPPADALLAKLETTQPISGAQVIAIEEHVDYWNHLGWTDPFSSADWTARQQDYGVMFRQDGYTPQMVVGGRSQFVGSRTDLAAKAIQEASQVVAVPVKLAKMELANPKEAHFTVSVGKLAHVSQGDSAEVWLAVTESGLASQVARGENAGRNLQHASVLRSLRRIGTADVHADTASFQGDAAVKLKSEWNRDHLSVVVLVQEKKSRHILGAASQKVADSGSATKS